VRLTSYSGLADAGVVRYLRSQDEGLDRDIGINLVSAEKGGHAVRS
jgi:hypothetical protein